MQEHSDLHVTVITSGPDGLVRHDLQLHELVAWMMAAGTEMTGHNRNPHQRAELQGQPKFRGFAGPMWDGEPGRPGIRYEDRQAYAELST